MLFRSNGAQAFYEQTVCFMEHKYGISNVRDKVSQTDAWKMQEERSEDYEKESRQQSEEFESLLEESGSSLPQKDNPIAQASKLREKPLLELIMPEGAAVSDKEINLTECPSGRKRNKGYGDFSDVAESPGAMSALLFGEYLLDHFSMAADREPKRTLDYELEYICAGKESDRENLEAVAKKLLMMRFASNYLFLQGSSPKRAEAEALALTLCTLAAVPVLEQAAAQMILLAWAFGESVMDLRSLLKGGRIPLAKTEKSWQLSLSGLMKLGESGEVNDGKDLSEGLLYKEYLRILLFLEKPEKAGMRALDLIEQNMKKVYGKTFYRADYCISRMEIKSTVQFRRGITYKFQTYFGYR